jgi:hypothetical protein
VPDQFAAQDYDGMMPMAKAIEQAHTGQVRKCRLERFTTFRYTAISRCVAFADTVQDQTLRRLVHYGRGGR